LRILVVKKPDVPAGVPYKPEVPPVFRRYARKVRHWLMPQETTHTNVPSEPCMALDIRLQAGIKTLDFFRKNGRMKYTLN
jgi:hypothetical protein